MYMQAYNNESWVDIPIRQQAGKLDSMTHVELVDKRPIPADVFCTATGTPQVISCQQIVPVDVENLPHMRVDTGRRQLLSVTRFTGTAEDDFPQSTWHPQKETVTKVGVRMWGLVADRRWLGWVVPELAGFAGVQFHATGCREFEKGLGYPLVVGLWQRPSPTVWQWTTYKSTTYKNPNQIKNKALCS